MLLLSNAWQCERGGGSSQYCNQNEKVAQNMKWIQRDRVGVLSYTLLLQPRCWSGAPSAAVKSQGSSMKASICNQQSGGHCCGQLVRRARCCVVGVSIQLHLDKYLVGGVYAHSDCVCRK